jgi:hypothetical protein
MPNTAAGVVGVGVGPGVPVGVGVGLGVGVGDGDGAGVAITGRRLAPVASEIVVIVAVWTTSGTYM